MARKPKESTMDAQPTGNAMSPEELAMLAQIHQVASAVLQRAAGAYMNPWMEPGGGPPPAFWPAPWREAPWSAGAPWGAGAPWSAGAPWATGAPWNPSWTAGVPWSAGNPWAAAMPWASPWAAGQPWFFPPWLSVPWPTEPWVSPGWQWPAWAPAPGTTGPAGPSCP